MSLDVNSSRATPQPDEVVEGGLTSKQEVGPFLTRAANPWRWDILMH